MSAPTHHLSDGLWCLIAAAALIAVSSASAEAQEKPQELCVTCEEPFAVYRCAFDDHSPIRVTAPGAPLACAKQLAHRGHHARCSIRRNSSGPCEGEFVVVTPPADTPLTPPLGLAADGNAGVPSEAVLADPPAVPGSVSGGVSGAASVATPGATPGEQLAPAAAPDGAAQGEVPEPEKPTGPPKTVEELAKRTAKSSKEGLEDAGEAVVGAAKKTGETIGEAGSAVGNAAKSTWRCLSTLFSDC